MTLQKQQQELAKAIIDKSKDVNVIFHKSFHAFNINLEFAMLQYINISGHYR